MRGVLVEGTHRERKNQNLGSKGKNLLDLRHLAKS